jgi:pseudouridine synthase
VLSQAGVCSRTEARAWIAAGRVRVRGEVVTDPERRVVAAHVTLDGAPLRRARHRYLVLHKPRGYVTTRRDPQGRKTVCDLLPPEHAALAPVGRLDLDTSGLLLFTNDTAFADLMTSPSAHLPKTYRIDAAPRLTDEAIAALRRGVVLRDGPTRPAQVRVLGARGRASWFEITITEGRNRQVRRMVQAAGSKVRRLVRVAIGPLALGDLPRGASRELSAAEVRALRGAASGRGSGYHSAARSAR